MADNKSIGH